MEQPHTIGQKIRTIRMGKGWTCSKLAKKLDCTRQYIHILENSYQDCSLETSIKIGKALGQEGMELISFAVKRKLASHGIKVEEKETVELRQVRNEMTLKLIEGA